MQRKSAASPAAGAVLVLSLIAAIVTASPTEAAKARPFEVGKPFPELVLPDLEDGKPTSLRQFRGRPLVLHVFASW